jgi:hypothetical protein
MLLGLLITTRRYKEHIVAILREARKEGHDLRVFMMDEGCLLLREEDFLQALQGLDVAVCDLNRRALGIEPPQGVRLGSQYDNARMAHECERLLVF